MNVGERINESAFLPLGQTERLKNVKIESIIKKHLNRSFNLLAKLVL